MFVLFFTGRTFVFQRLQGSLWKDDDSKDHQDFDRARMKHAYEKMMTEKITKTLTNEA